MTDIYQVLDDGRIMEFRLGRQSEQDHAIWARSLTTNDKRIYLRLKGMGYSDMNIYNHLNQLAKTQTGSGR